MTQKSLRLLSLSIMASLSITTMANAQEANTADSKFSKIDNFISQQKQSQTPPVDMKVVPAEEPQEKADIVIAKEDSPVEVVEEIQPPAELLVPVTAIPPLSQFLFKNDIYLTSNKLGKVFIAGGGVFDIDKSATESEIAKILSSASAPSCALTSNKSNVMMRGENSSAPQTYLELSDVSLLSFEHNGESDIVYRFSFKDKTPLNQTASSAKVSVEALCGVPERYKNNPQEMTLSDVSVAFNGLFDFKIAMYIEI
jgi:hypothetical protein